MSESMINLRPKLIITIVDRSKGKKAMDVFKKLRTHWHYVICGEGTANSETMELLGLGTSDKSIVLCIEPQFRVPEFLASIEKELKLYERGKGVAFTIPISGVNHPIIKKLEEEINIKPSEEMKKEVKKMIEDKKKEINHSVVLGILDQGYSEDVMATAKKHGASGGTIIHSRRVGVEDAVKFLGISLQEEKEILMIVTTKEKRRTLMKELSSAHGVSSDAKGIFLSLPVEDIIGINLD